MVTPSEVPELDADQVAICALYQRMLDAWNRRDGDAFAECFAFDGAAIGFDGSQHNGRESIGADLRTIFEHHVTPAYVASIRSVRLLAPTVGTLQAASGLVPPGQQDIRPELKAIQCVVAVKDHDGWSVASLQNTPAQFHGRQELAEQLTEELRRILAGED